MYSSVIFKLYHLTYVLFEKLSYKVLKFNTLQTIYMVIVRIRYNLVIIFNNLNLNLEKYQELKMILNVQEYQYEQL